VFEESFDSFNSSRWVVVKGNPVFANGTLKLGYRGTVQLMEPLSRGEGEELITSLTVNVPTDLDVFHFFPEGERSELNKSWRLGKVININPGNFVAQRELRPS